MILPLLRVFRFFDTMCESEDDDVEIIVFDTWTLISMLRGCHAAPVRPQSLQTVL